MNTKDAWLSKEKRTVTPTGEEKKKVKSMETVRNSSTVLKVILGHKYHNH